MKCLCKYDLVKLPRDYPDMGKGLMSHWAKLASRAAFRKGIGTYCGHKNPVQPGMWAGGIVGVKAILGVRSRAMAFQILDHLQALGYLTYTLNPETKLLTYQITDWVMECTGGECMDGAVYATPPGQAYQLFNSLKSRGSVMHNRRKRQVAFSRCCLYSNHTRLPIAPSCLLQLRISQQQSSLLLSV